MHARTAAIRLLGALALNCLTFAAVQGEQPGSYRVISEQQARAIAWSAGLVHVEEITQLADRWEIAGRSIDDDEMLLDIDIRNGRILD